MLIWFCYNDNVNQKHKQTEPNERRTAVETDLTYAVPYIRALKAWGVADREFEKFKERYSAFELPDHLPCYDGKAPSMFTFFMAHVAEIRDFVRLLDKMEKARYNVYMTGRDYYSGAFLDADDIARDYKAIAEK